jgi:HEAT repeat protein
VGLTDNTYGEDAARSLIEMGSVAEEFVLKYADHRDDAVRTRAYNVLTEIGTEKSIPKLRGFITKEKDPFMKDRVKEMLEKIKQRVDDAKASADPDSPFSTKPKN